MCVTYRLLILSKNFNVIGLTVFCQNEYQHCVQMPSYEWGLMKTPYSSRSDLVSAYKKANWKCIAESSTVKLRLIDEARMNEVDNFYKVS